MSDIVPLCESDTSIMSEHPSDISFEDDGICSSPERSTYCISEGIIFHDNSRDPTFSQSNTDVSDTDYDTDLSSDDVEEELSILMQKSTIIAEEDDNECDSRTAIDAEETQSFDFSRAKHKVINTITCESECDDVMTDPCMVTLFVCSRECYTTFNRDDDMKSLLLSSFHACIVKLSCLKNLAELCPPKLCTSYNKALEIHEHHDNTAIDLYWACSNGHVETRLASQPHLKYGISVINALLPAAIVTTGNTYGKTKRLMEALNIKCIYSCNFFTNQKEVVVPEVNEMFTEVTEKARKRHAGEEVVIMGDVGCDSPGHDAKYCVNTMMCLNTRDILAMYVADKRHTDLKSSNMEKRGFLKCMEQLLGSGLNIVEVVTDAHTSIAKEMRRK